MRTPASEAWLATHSVVTSTLGTAYAAITASLGLRADHLVRDAALSSTVLTRLSRTDGNIAFRMDGEVDRYRQRTSGSRALIERGRRTMPLGVESNFRFFEPYPIFIDRALGARIWDVDGHEYIDHALCFGALMVGHAHPAIVRAVSAQAERGLMFGMPHLPMLELAEELTT